MTETKNITDLQVLKENIEKLDINEQIGLLHYLNDNINNNLKNIISENQNGIFINLSVVSDIFIDHLRYYLDYITAQRQHLDSLENEKDKLKKYFNNNLSIFMSVKNLE